MKPSRSGNSLRATNHPPRGQQHKYQCRLFLQADLPVHHLLQRPVNWFLPSKGFRLPEMELHLVQLPLRLAPRLLGLLQFRPVCYPSSRVKHNRLQHNIAQLLPRMLHVKTPRAASGNRRRLLSKTRQDSSSRMWILLPFQ